jgi:hypothetical protein
MNDSTNSRPFTIGLATNWDYHDYGGMLQAFATQIAIESLGYKAEAIDIGKLKGDITKRKLIYFARNILDPSIVGEKAAVVSKKLRMKLNASFKENMAKRDAGFDQFCKSNFRVSRPVINWDDLKEQAHRYDAVVVGSDQLWLPSNIAGDYYTLSFVPDPVKRISYATSFGVKELPAYQEDRARRFLSRIDCLSTRETSGQNIIEKYTGRKVPLVCDPTLLLDVEEWKKYATDYRCTDKPYIFCYLMGDNPGQRLFVRELKKETGCEIVSLLHLDRYIKSDEDFPDYAPYDITPADFLSLIENAAFVCTDSFHGTIFSVLFGRPFFVFPRFTKRATLSTNTRIESLLLKLDIQDRLVLPGTKPQECLSRNLNYHAIAKALIDFRNESFGYLSGAIEGQIVR